MERVIEDKTEREFLEWLYEVIGDDKVDYLWGISGRIGELKAIESIAKINRHKNGCGESFRSYPDNEKLNRMYFTCGDNRMHDEDDEPNLCEECKKVYYRLIEEHRKNWNPDYKKTATSNNNANSEVEDGRN